MFIGGNCFFCYFGVVVGIVIVGLGSNFVMQCLLKFEGVLGLNMMEFFGDLMFVEQKVVVELVQSGYGVCFLMEERMSCGDNYGLFGVWVYGV